MMEKDKKNIDYRLLAYFAILILFGLLVLSSASVALGAQRFGDSYFFIKKQILLGLFPGIVGFLFLVNIDYNFWKKYSLIFYFLGILLLLAVFIPSFGQSYNTHAKSWLNIFGFSFQPAEAMKFVFIIYLSDYLSELKDDIIDYKIFLKTLVVGAIPIILILFQPDFGTMLILSGIFYFLLICSQARIWHLFFLALLGIFLVVILLLSVDHSADRFAVFLHPELDPQGKGYHINQAFLAVGSGGILGLGLGNSRQKFQYLPEVQADSIFAIMAEELGFITVSLFIFLFVVIIFRSFRIAKNSENEFGRLLICGIISWWTIQSLMNIGAIVGILPLTGVPLPFVSHGGTSLFINMLALGVLLNVSKTKTHSI